MLLVLAGFLSFAALVAVLYLLDDCPDRSPEGWFGPCATTPSAQLLILAGAVAGPAAVLAYRLRPSVPWRMRWRAGLPEGLSSSRLGTADEAGDAGGL